MFVGVFQKWRLIFDGGRKEGRSGGYRVLLGIVQELLESGKEGNWCLRTSLSSGPWFLGGDGDGEGN